MKSVQKVLIVSLVINSVLFCLDESVKPIKTLKTQMQLAIDNADAPKVKKLLERQGFTDLTTPIAPDSRSALELLLDKAAGYHKPAQQKQLAAIMRMFLVLGVDQNARIQGMNAYNTSVHYLLRHSLGYDNIVLEQLITSPDFDPFVTNANSQTPLEMSRALCIDNPTQKARREYIEGLLVMAEEHAKQRLKHGKK